METINHECYVSLEVAKLLKEAGFDWEVNHSYPDCGSLDNSCSGYMEDLPFYHNLNDGKYEGMSAPTLAVAQRWLRETQIYHVDAEPLCSINKYTPLIWYNFWMLPEDVVKIAKGTEGEESYDTYEEALEMGIKKCLEIILEKNE